MAGLIFGFSACGSKSDSRNPNPDSLIEDTMVSYPGRTFSYKDKFRDTQSKQVQAARAIGLATPPKDRQHASKMRDQLKLVKTNENYVVDFFLSLVSTAKVPIFEFVCGVSHPFPSYKFSLYSRYCVREYQPNAQCPFAGCNKCARKDDGGCGERLSSPTRSPPYIAFSYHSKYSICPADCRFLSRIRHRFLFFAPWRTASISDKAASAGTPACACPCS